MFVTDAEIAILHLMEYYPRYVLISWEVPALLRSVPGACPFIQTEVMEVGRLFSVVPCAFALFLMAQTLHPGPASAGIVDPCQSSVTSGGGTVVACPKGDGMTLAEAGVTISITILDGNGQPIPNIPGADFWLIGCSNGLILCGGSASSGADSLTNSLGQTTMSQTTIAASGNDTGVYVVVQGFVITGDPGCLPTCLPINVRSVDLTGDLVVNNADEGVFVPSYTSPPNTYNAAFDFDNNGVIDLSDLIILRRHSQPPGHSCF